MTNNTDGRRGGIGLVTLLQVVFIILHYSDPCLKTHKSCNTTIANWPWYYVWMPMIISLSFVILVGMGFCVVLCMEQHNIPPKEEEKEPLFFDKAKLNIVVM